MHTDTTIESRIFFPTVMLELESEREHCCAYKYIRLCSYKNIVCIIWNFQVNENVAHHTFHGVTVLQEKQNKTCLTWWQKFSG